MNEYTDFLCGCAIQIGNYLKIRKISFGWLVTMLSILYWVARGWDTGFYSQTFWHGVSFCMASYGFYKWRMEND